MGLWPILGAECLAGRPSRSYRPDTRSKPRRLDTRPRAFRMTPEQLKVAADTAWTLLTAFLVFFMNAGFGLIEAGLCRKKNATMILSKNFVVFAISTLGFYFVGFGLMFSDGGFMGWAGGWLLSGATTALPWGNATAGSSVLSVGPVFL